MSVPHVTRALTPPAKGSASPFPVSLRLTREDALAPVVLDLLAAELPVSARAAVLSLALQLRQEVTR